ncbi:hypothetical protein J6590_046669 [Homalodisca vitripennis]|nr:hypothetical protein J6590_046669 [Homalodisca vitripennis]
MTAVPTFTVVIVDKPMRGTFPILLGRMDRADNDNSEMGLEEERRDKEGVREGEKLLGGIPASTLLDCPRSSLVNGWASGLVQVNLSTSLRNIT